MWIRPSRKWVSKAGLFLLLKRPVPLAIAIDGEPINTTTMIYTPTAVSTYGNIFGAIFIDIPRGCCGKVSVRNISTIPVSVQNANLIVERVA